MRIFWWILMIYGFIIHLYSRKKLMQAIIFL